MNTKQALTLAFVATLSLAGAAAHADDITIVNDNFVAQRTRAEVKAEVLNAHAAGVTEFVTEAHAGVAGNDAVVPAVRSALTRDQVRADLRNAPKVKIVTYNPLA